MSAPLLQIEHLAKRFVGLFPLPQKVSDAKACSD